jgi:hypothetical protein
MPEKKLSNPIYIVNGAASCSWSINRSIMYLIFSASHKLILYYQLNGEKLDFVLKDNKFSEFQINRYQKSIKLNFQVAVDILSTKDFGRASRL